MEAAAFFICVTALVLVPIWLRGQSRVATLKLMGEAIARGQPIDPAFAQQLAAPASDTTRWFTLVCLFCGAPALTMGIGVGLAFWLFPEALAGYSAHNRTEILMPAIFGGSAGFGLTVLGLFAARFFRRNPDM